MYSTILASGTESLSSSSLSSSWIFDAGAAVVDEAAWWAVDTDDAAAVVDDADDACSRLDTPECPPTIRDE